MQNKTIEKTSLRAVPHLFVLRKKMSNPYQALVSNDRLCEAVGRAVLACGYLENSIKSLLAKRGHIDDPERKRMLGNLFGILKEKEFLGRTMEYHLGFLIQQRNYFIHRIVEYLQDYELDDRDIQMFTNRAMELRMKSTL